MHYTLPRNHLLCTNCLENLYPFTVPLQFVIILHYMLMLKVPWLQWNNFQWKFGELELGPLVVSLYSGIFSGPQKQFLSSLTISFPSVCKNQQRDWTWARWKAHTQNMRCNSLVFIFENVHLVTLVKNTLLFVHFDFKKIERHVSWMEHSIRKLKHYFKTSVL